jgi:hypothetical protein
VKGNSATFSNAFNKSNVKDAPARGKPQPGSSNLPQIVPGTDCTAYKHLMSQYCLQQTGADQSKTIIRKERNRHYIPSSNICQGVRHGQKNKFASSYFCQDVTL